MSKSPQFPRRRPPLATVGKILRACQDGPWKGEALYLSDGKSAEFKVGDHHGYYDNGRWVKTPMAGKELA